MSKNGAILEAVRVNSGIGFRAGGGFGGNGNTGFEPLRSKNAMHPVGCGGKIDAKSMPEKGMQKLAQMEPKWSPMGDQNL